MAKASSSSNKLPRATVGNVVRQVTFGGNRKTGPAGAVKKGKGK